MRALVADPSRPQAVRLAEVAEPVAGPGQVLVEVHHASLNYGDLNDARSGRVPPGAVLGSDVAGVVLQAGDGGPAPGSRVVALAPGAFGERVVAEAGSLAEVPATVGLAQAAGAGADAVEVRAVDVQGDGGTVADVADAVDVAGRGEACDLTGQVRVAADLDQSGAVVGERVQVLVLHAGEDAEHAPGTWSWMRVSAPGCQMMATIENEPSGSTCRR